MAAPAPAGVTDRPLARAACASRCAYRPVAEAYAGLPRFRCDGCGAEWARSEPWTPAEADGRVAPLVAAEAARR